VSISIAYDPGWYVVCGMGSRVVSVGGALHTDSQKWCLLVEPAAARTARASRAGDAIAGGSLGGRSLHSGPMQDA
jgi:hypothetical protein